MRQPAQQPPSLTRRRLEELFGIDRRTMALFRVGLGCVLLGDLATRARHLSALYTDQGMLPRAVFLAECPESWLPSLHLLTGSPPGQVVLFLLATVSALSLLAGYRTRLATVACWVLLYSVRARNPFVLTGSSAVLLQMLLWSIFLPLGMYWSVDRALDTSGRPPPQRVLSVASFGLMAHIGMIYVFSTYFKAGPAWRTDLTALYYGLNIDSITTPIGIALIPHLRLLKGLTLGVWLLEAAGPIGAFSPLFFGPLRCFVVLCFMALHVGIALCFDIGMFPYTMLVAWTVWIPGWFWDRAVPARGSRARQNLCIYYDGDCGFCLRMVRLLHTFLLLHESRYAPAQSDPAIAEVLERENSWVVVAHDGARYLRFEAFIYLCRCSPLLWFLVPLLRLAPVARVGDAVYRAMAHRRETLGGVARWLTLRPQPLPSRPRRWVGIFVTTALLVFVLMFNVASVVSTPVRRRIFSPRLERLGRLLQLQQGWAMFSPEPRKEDGWLVMVSVLADGTLVDLSRDGAPVDWTKPPLVSAMFPTQRMWTYHMSLLDRRSMEGQPLFREYGRYVLDRWNTAHDGTQQARELLIFWMRERTPPPGGQPQEPAQPILVYTHGTDRVGV